MHASVWVHLCGWVHVCLVCVHVRCAHTGVDVCLLRARGCEFQSKTYLHLFGAQDTDFQKCLEEAEQIEKLYSHFFDATIVNEDIDITYEELLTVIKKFTTGPQWVPTGWVM